MAEHLSAEGELVNEFLNLLACTPRFHFTYETLSQPTSFLTFTLLIFFLIPLGGVSERLCRVWVPNWANPQQGTLRFPLL